MMRKKPLIAFIGIDGSGKTTLIKEVSKLLDEDKNKYKIVYMGLGANQHIPFLKGTMKLYSRLRYGKERIKMEYHKSRDIYRQRTFLWILIQYTEFWVRYLRAKKYSKKHIIFFDRFFYDGLIFGGPISFHTFRHLTPKIDLCFLITAPSKIIRGRKKEAKIRDIEKFYKKAEILSRYFPIIKIDNSEEIRRVVKKIYQRIYEEIKTSTFKIPEKKLYLFLNKNNIRYAVLRGYNQESRKKGKDLDILILKEDYNKLKRLKIPDINRILDFYVDKEEHHGVVFLNKKALFRRKFDSDLGFFILSRQDYLRMKFFRKSLKIYWFFRKLIKKSEKKK